MIITSNKIRSTIITSSRSERRVSMISVNTCALSAITASLPFSYFRALLELVLVLQPGIQPLQMRLVPEHIGFLFHFDRPRHPVPYQKRVADIFQDRTTAAAHTPALRQFPRDRLGRIKDAGNLAFVPGEDDALGQRLATRMEPVRRQALQADRAAGRNLVIFITGPVR